ncbi:hypothetical protein AWV80_17500 [Cupriavidus sp. UYMU48A]|nr:hypothetical protein AWV80_17500 [Cupriavidus sp. UYMU48A]
MRIVRLSNSISRMAFALSVSFSLPSDAASNALAAVMSLSQSQVAADRTFSGTWASRSSLRILSKEASILAKPSSGFFGSTWILR